MPDFLIELNKDGTIRQTYKDGMPIPGAKLEMRESIVQTYFKACEKNLLEMKKITDDSDLRRLFGLQSFLMSLLGVEAFLNVFFHAVAREKKPRRCLEYSPKASIDGRRDRQPVTQISLWISYFISETIKSKTQRTLQS